MLVQTFIPKSAIEDFDMNVICWLARSVIINRHPIFSAQALIALHINSGPLSARDVCGRQPCSLSAFNNARTKTGVLVRSHFMAAVVHDQSFTSPSLRATVFILQIFYGITALWSLLAGTDFVSRVIGFISKKCSLVSGRASFSALEQAL